MCIRSEGLGVSVITSSKPAVRVPDDPYKARGESGLLCYSGLKSTWTERVPRSGGWGGFLLEMIVFRGTRLLIEEHERRAGPSRLPDEMRRRRGGNHLEPGQAANKRGRGVSLRLLLYGTFSCGQFALFMISHGKRLTAVGRRGGGGGQSGEERRGVANDRGRTGNAQKYSTQTLRFSELSVSFIKGTRIGRLSV